MILWFRVINICISINLPFSLIDCGMMQASTLIPKFFNTFETVWFICQSCTIEFDSVRLNGIGDENYQNGKWHV